MRKLSTVNTARVYDTVTRPVWLVQILFATPLYFSSRGAITYAGISYLAAGLKVSVAQRRIALVNDAFGYTDEFLAGAIGSAVKVYQVFGDTAFVAGDADLVLVGQVGRVTIGPEITIEVREAQPRRVPRAYPVVPTFNHIPPPGTVIQTPGGPYVLDER